MGYIEETMSLLPNCYNLYFPAFLNHKNGVDKTIVDFKRPLIDNRIRVSAF